MTDALEKLRRQKEERDQQELRDAVIMRAVGDYERATRIMDGIGESLDFSVSDKSARDAIKAELNELWRVINEIVPAQIRQEYETRKATRNINVTGGDVM
jgi:ribosomal protein L23